MGILIETKRYASCLECGDKVGSIEHLDGDDIREIGPWFCESCGRGWWIRTNGRDVCDMVLDERRRWIPATATVTLVLPPQKDPIVLTLHARVYDELGKEFGEGCAYFYDEHTCPTNWMRDVAEIRIRDNADPHGLFKFQKIQRGHLERDHATGALKHEGDQ
jgi:hypothetical protein